MQKIHLITEQNSAFVQSLSSLLSAQLYTVKSEIFPCGEIKLHDKEYDFVENKEIVYSYQPNRTNINESLLRLLITLKQIQYRKPRTLTLLMPYLPYSRHDKEAAPLLSHLIDLLQNIGITGLISIDIHNPEIFIGKPFVQNITTESYWAEAISKKFDPKKDTICIATPDAGGCQRAQAIAHQINAPLITLKKKRSNEGMSVALEEGNPTHKTVLLIDDIIDTGTTALKAAKLLKQKGADKVIGCFTHAVLSRPEHIATLENCFDQFMISDSIPTQLQSPKWQQIHLLENNQLQEQLRSKFDLRLTLG